jgi:hypothetical protein
MTQVVTPACAPPSGPINAETAALLHTLALQVKASDPAGQFVTIERIGLERLFTPEMMLGAFFAGGLELVTFLATLGTEHATDPARCQRIQQACQQMQNRVTLEMVKVLEVPRPAKKPAPRGDQFIILDNIFPVLPSGFRLAEYNAYLEHYPTSAVYSTGAAFHFVNETRPFAEVLQDYRAVYPEFGTRVRCFDPRALPPARLFYTVFINNAHRFLPVAEATGTPFVFTLYPGGGFQLNDAKCDAKLRRVFASPCFRAVIVTQSITERYLLEKKFCRPDQIRYVFGGVLAPRHSETELRPKRRYGIEKPELDVCFVANKYMPGGIDKGFDVFLDVARRLAAAFPMARFHVVGTFGRGDGDFSGLDGRVHLHGVLPTDALQRVFADMDLILSPNVPFMLKPGAFDGFPTGSCVEAGLSGVAVFCTDELKLNTAFTPGQEIVIVPRNAEKIFATIAEYCREPSRLHQVAANGAAAFRRVFSFPNQMNARFTILDEFLARDLANSS